MPRVKSRTKSSAEAPDNIIEKIRKLLTLGEEGRGATEAERDLALQRAQELMLKWNLDVALVQTHAEGGEKISQSQGLKTTRRNHWQGQLLSYIAQHNLGRVYTVSYRDTAKTKQWVLVGRPTNVRFILELHEYLVEQLSQECKVELGKQREFVRNPNAFRRAFFDAAAGRIYARLSEMARARTQEHGESAVALVKHESAEIDQFLEGLGLRPAPRRRRPGDVRGGVSGDQAGRKADLFPGRKLGEGS